MFFCRNDFTCGRNVRAFLCVCVVFVYSNNHLSDEQERMQRRRIPTEKLCLQQKDFVLHSQEMNAQNGFRWM